VKTLTLEQAIQAGLPAEAWFWRMTFDADGRGVITNAGEIRFPPAKEDGIIETLPIPPVPVHGWRHLPGCYCEFCSE
jgi:hypothetical protein